LPKRYDIILENVSGRGALSSEVEVQQIPALRRSFDSIVNKGQRSYKLAGRVEPASFGRVKM
jgi:hypothetical protein